MAAQGNPGQQAFSQGTLVAGHGSSGLQPSPSVEKEMEELGEVDLLEVMNEGYQEPAGGACEQEVEES